MTGSAPATANNLLARPATISSSGINRPLCFQRKPNEVPVAETISARNRNGVQSESAHAHHSNRVHYRGEVNAMDKLVCFSSRSVFKKPPAFGYAWPQAPGSGDPIHQFRRCDVRH